MKMTMEPVLSPPEDKAAAALEKAKSALVQEIDGDADRRDQWKKRNRYYHSQLEDLCASLIPAGSDILEIGCSTGGLLAALKPAKGLGLDMSPRCIAMAKVMHPELTFQS